MSKPLIERQQPPAPSTLEVVATDILHRPIDGTFLPATLAETATVIRRNPTNADRTIYEFIRGFNEAPLNERRALYVETPTATGDYRYDALLAGLAEHLALLDRDRCLRGQPRAIDFWRLPGTGSIFDRAVNDCERSLRPRLHDD